MDFPPTDEQQAITSAGRDSNLPLMIRAYAGTGKTTTLKLLAKALPPKPSLALAFNVKIKQTLEKEFPSNFEVKTMNGLGHSAWTRYIGGKVQVDEKKLGKIVTRLAGEHDVHLGEEGWGETLRLVSAAMIAGLVPDFFSQIKPLFTLDTPQNWENLADDADSNPDFIFLARECLIESIKMGLGTNGPPTISYDDQIYLPTTLGATFPKYPLVMVDEAQDLSVLQHHMVAKVSKGGRLIVVGDPKQAIYAFRGADSSSMDKLKNLNPEWIELPLTLTFRCPKVVVDLQQEHAPGYRAAATNKAGRVIDLRGLEQGWTWADVPQDGQIAVLCRNNAPLLSLAMKLLTKGVACVMLGRDVGKGLQSLAKKIITNPSTPAPECRLLIQEWQRQEEDLAKINEKQHKLASIQDRAECLLAVLEHARDGADLLTKLKDLFSRDRGKVTFSSGHRAKGLEWDTVLELDPWRIPSKQARKAAQAGFTSQLDQEYNLRYVIQTRTKNVLIQANLEDFIQT